MGLLGDIWNKAQYAVPVYGQVKGASDLMGSNALTNKNVPTQLTDRDKISGLIDQGMGQGGITSQVAPSATAAQAGPAPQAQAASLQLGADPFRQGQIQQVGQLQGIASGQQQGAGELAAQRQIQQALAAQQAQARMARGGNAALAYRNAANQSAALGATGAGMGQRAALQDQAQAQAALTGALGQGRGMDVNVAGQNAGFAQQAGLQNAQMGQQTNLANAGLQQQAGLQNAQLAQQQQQQNAQNYLALLQQLYGLNATELGFAQAPVLAANQTQAGLLGGALSAGGQAAGVMMSDERLKTDVSDADREIDDMLDKLKAKAWTYKDPKHGEGRWTGIMAQAMESSEAGRRVVRDEPDGKALDVNKALSTALAATARLNERLRAVEGR